MRDNKQTMLDAIRDGLFSIATGDIVHSYNRAFAKMWDLPLFDEKNQQTYESIKAHIEAHITKIGGTIPDCLLNKAMRYTDTQDMYIKEDLVIEQRLAQDADSERGISHVWMFRDVTELKQQKQERALH